MSKELNITQEELLSELQTLDPKLFDLAVERVAGRKRAEYIEELEERLGITEMGDDAPSDRVASDDQPEQEKV